MITRPKVQDEETHPRLEGRGGGGDTGEGTGGGRLSSGVVPGGRLLDVAAADNKKLY